MSLFNMSKIKAYLTLILVLDGKQLLSKKFSPPYIEVKILWGREVGRNFGFATFPNGGLIWHMTYWFLTSGNNQRDFVWSLYPMLPHPGRIAVVFDILLSVVCMTRGSIKCYIGFSNSNILLYLRPRIRTKMTVELFLKALRARQYYDVNEVNIYHLL